MASTGERAEESLSFEALLVDEWSQLHLVYRRRSGRRRSATLMIVKLHWRAISERPRQACAISNAGPWRGKRESPAGKRWATVGRPLASLSRSRRFDALERRNNDIRRRCSTRSRAVQDGPLSVSIAHCQFDTLATLRTMRKCPNGNSIFSRMWARGSGKALHKSRASAWYHPRRMMTS